jgi:hypothetical protein
MQIARCDVTGVGAELVVFRRHTGLALFIPRDKMTLDMPKQIAP